MRLHEAAEKRYRSRCPCCERPMTKTEYRPGKPDAGTMRTRGHDQAIGFGGDAQVWLYMCRRCNNQQGWLTFAAWARMLILRDDPRADLVVEVARFVNDWRTARSMRAA